MQHPTGSELLLNNSKYIKAYQKAREEGTREVYHTRIMIVGQYGVGKTSLKKRLLDQGYDKEHIPTDGIHVDPSACYIDISNSVIWKTKAKGFKSAKDTDDPKEIHDGEVAKKLLHAIMIQGIAPNDNVSSGDIDDSHTTPEDIPENIISKVESLAAVKNQEEKQLKLSFWDFGGQHVFYTTHQTFLTDRAIYLLVVDLTKDLDEKVETFRQSRSGKKLDATAPKTVKDYLDYWLNSIHTHTGKSSSETESLSPPVIIVGTHKDIVNMTHETDQQNLDDYFLNLNLNIQDKVYFPHVCKTYFAVDNQSDDDSELNELKEKIVELAEEQRFWGQEVPIKWLLLEKRLIEFKVGTADQHPRHFLKFDEVAKIGFKEGLDEDSVRACLEFYHSVGDIIYFNEINLNDLVILDPQWLIDVFKSIITVPKFHRFAKGRNTLDSNVWDKLDKYGVLQEQFIETVWKKLYADIAIHSDVMIELMQRFDLICPFRNCVENIHEKRQFFVPCLLPKRESSDIDVMKNKPLVCGALFFKFSFLPKGLFHRLVAKICNANTWFLHGNVFFDYVKFKIADGFHVLTLLAEDNHIEIQLHQLSKGMTNHGKNAMCTRIREDVEANLKSTIKNYCPNVRFEVSVRCRCQDVPEEAQMLVPILEKDINLGQKLCEFHPDLIELHRHKLWYNIEQLVEQTQGELSDIELLDIGMKLGYDIEEVAIRLGMSQHQVQTMKLSNQQNAKTWGLNILVSWRNEQDRGVDKRKALADALRRSKRADLADQVLRSQQN
ncbi:unnamed protein product [Owenia fusiformis]|uniref:non-specific serine/threonine protein kinase n=1 Tax=Owenia fusiformis TaxID=6347 RepID=A0A8S4P034_OWEFU|nr:unnamed protein product [Owenia fusiformis]